MDADNAVFKSWMLCHVLSRFRLPLAAAASALVLPGGEGRWKEPAAISGVGYCKWKERNVGQLCHAFEVGTACLWSGGRALSFHVLLSCDLGRPQLHKPYWLSPEKNTKNNKHWHNLFQHLWGSEAWSSMKCCEWESAGSFKASPWHDLQTGRH